MKTYDITTEQIVEAGARALAQETLIEHFRDEAHFRDQKPPSDDEVAGIAEEWLGVALAAMLPLIRKQLADEVRNNPVRFYEDDRQYIYEEATEDAARLIEGVEL